MTETPAWYVAYCNPRCEQRASKGLREKGFDAYCPALVEWSGWRRGKRATIVRPLFPRYLFVAVAASRGFFEVRATDGIEQLLGDGGTPRAIDAGLVEQLRTAETLGLFDKTTRREPVFAVGQAVRILAGPLTGFTAKVLRAPASGRVDLLLEFFGRQSRVAVDPCVLGAS